MFRLNKPHIAFHVSDGRINTVAQNRRPDGTFLPPSGRIEKLSYPHTTHTTNNGAVVLKRRVG